MKKILGAKNYKKLDHNVSFQLARTNPVLTSNVKLVYDGSNMFLDSYDVNDTLKSETFKKNRVFCNDLYNKNLKDYWSRNTDDSMFDISEDVDMYKCGVVLPDNYDNKFGYIAPLYIKEKMPEYFVIFKVSEKDDVDVLPTTTLYDESIFDTSDEVEVDTDYNETLDYITYLLKLGRNEIYDGCVSDVLTGYNLSLDDLCGDSLYIHELYQELSEKYSSWKNSYDLKQSKRFKNDIKIYNEISKLEEIISEYYSTFYGSSAGQVIDVKELKWYIDFIIRYIIDILVLKDKLYNKQLEATSPLIQMCYHCYLNNLEVQERLDYYNLCFKKFYNWKFRKWGSKIKMVMEMEQLLAFYKNEEVDESYYFTINEDNMVVLVEHEKVGILQKSTIIKTFDLSEHTTLGQYIRNYINQRTFEFNKPMYVDYNTANIYYYGIDKKTGQLTKIVENYRTELISTERNITYTDNYLTTRYKEKGLYFPYILNLEFLFDDDDSDGYRYYGLYCNSIDLYQHRYTEPDELTETSYVPEKMELESETTTTLVEELEDKILDRNKYCRKVIEVEQISNSENVYFSDGESVFYVKDKKRDLHTIPQYKHVLQSHMFTESKGSYERANVLINRMLGDEYKFNKLTCHDVIQDSYNTYFHYVDPTDIFNTNLDYDKIFGYIQDSLVVDCERYDDAYRASLGFFIEDRPINGSSICIKVLNKNLKLENGEYFVNREIHLTAKEEDIIHIHDKYFGKDVDKPYDDDYDQELYPDFGNMDKEFPIEDETFVFGDEDGYTGEVPVKNLMQEGILTMEGECPFVGVGIVYEKDSTTVPITFYKYDVTMDVDKNKVTCKSVKKLNRTSVFKDKVIEELLGYTPPKNYIRAIDDALENSNEIRIYPQTYTYTLVQEEDSDESEVYEEGSTMNDLVSARGEISVKVDASCPFMGLGLYKDIEGNIIKYFKYAISFCSSTSCSSMENCVNLKAIEEYYDTEGIGVEGMIDKIFGDEFKLATWHLRPEIVKTPDDSDDSDGCVTDIIVALPKIVIKHTAFPEEDLTDEEKEALTKGAYDRADTENFDYILRDENYKNLFITEPMRPGTFHITKNKTIYYSNNGTTRDIAYAICKAINSCPEWDREIEAYQKKNLIVFRHAIKGSKYNGEHVEIEVTFDTSYLHNKKIRMLCERYNKKDETYGECVFRFTGGTNSPKNTFLVNNSDVPEISNDFGEERFIKTDRKGVLTRIQAINPYVDNEGNVDLERSVMVTDQNGKFISSGKNRIEFMQRYYPNIGALSFLPFKDFDTDILYSIYGDTDKINEEFSLTGNTRQANIRDSWGNVITSEYEYYDESKLDFESLYGKPVSLINKWSNVDYLDTCGNPYRLNVSGVFGRNNITSDLWHYGGDLDGLTHSMPYIIMPKYMYNKSDSLERIDYPFNTDNYIVHGILNDDFYMWEYKDYIDSWNIKLMRLNEVDFKDMFYGRYSLIQTQDNMGTYTIFNGVKFNFDDSCDGYKFSFVYIPIYTEKDNLVNKVFMIKNDINKFICGVMYVSVYNTTMFNYTNLFDSDDNFFNLSYIYNMLNGDVEVKETNLSFNFETDFDYIGVFELNNVKVSDIGLVETENAIDWNEGILVTSVLFNDIITYIKENTPEGNDAPVEVRVFNGEGANVFDSEQYLVEEVETLENIIYENEMFRFKNGDKSIRTGVVSGFEHDVRVSFTFRFYKCSKTNLKLFFDGLREVCERTNTIEHVKSRYDIYSAVNIQECLNDDEHVQYISEDGVDFTTSIADIEYSGPIIHISMKNRSYTMRICRHNGYYEPLVREGMKIRDMYTLDSGFPYSNTVIDIE